MWLKIKIWVKSLIFGAILLYALVFLIMNTGQTPVMLWFWYNTRLQISPLLLVFMTFLTGIIAAILFRATLTTIRQIRESRDKSRTARLEREVSEMKTKAARLQTRANPTTRPAEATDAIEPTEGDL